MVRLISAGKTCRLVRPAVGAWAGAAGGGGRLLVGAGVAGEGRAGQAGEADGSQSGAAIGVVDRLIAKGSLS